MKGKALIHKQLMVLGSASAVGIVVLAMVFLRVPEALSIGRYTVSAEFVEGAGIYDGAQVSYLGHPIGKVSALELGDDRIVARFKLTDDVEVPAGVTAEIHSRSAVGEQYVELVPPSSGTATLAEGDVIPLERTSYPVEIGPVLDNVHALLESLPRGDLATLVDESGQLFDGRDGDLQDILDGGLSLIEAADASFEPTKALIRDAEPLLRAVNSRSANIESFTSDLAQVTAELRAGDDDLRTLLAKGPRFAGEAVAFLDDLEAILPALLQPLNITAGVLSLYRHHLAEILSTYPQAVGAVQSVTLSELGSHDVRLTLANADKPAACLQGFLPVNQWRSPFDTTLVDTPLLYCSEEPSDPRAVKGARNVPCPNDPTRRAPTPALCRQ
ncbi:MAG TPA: MCE family protein [Nocardioidaceae bacterium]|nr:MCE family protein [Nocardioidaceae bacterium]